MQLDSFYDNSTVIGINYRYLKEIKTPVAALKRTQLKSEMLLVYDMICVIQGDPTELI